MVLHAHPLYKYLTTEAKGILGSESIKWNFTKFLINQNGEVVKRYAPTPNLKKLPRIFKDFWLNVDAESELLRGLLAMKSFASNFSNFYHSEHRLLK